MKKLFIAMLFCAVGLVAAAQPGHPSGTSPHTPPPPARHTVSFESQHGESFSVYLDGNLQNRMPQTRVLLNDVSGGNHEVIVVMKRPADKAAILRLRPGERNVTVNVNYDSRLEELYLYTPEHNRAPREVEVVQAPNRPDPRSPRQLQAQLQNINQTVIVNQPVASPEAEVRIAEADEVTAMAARMKAQSFDSDRLALGKVIVASANLTATQIAYLAQTIDFSNTQVEFLKYAYQYCVDKNNYYKTVDILTFSSDKKKVLDYIATQK